MESSAPLTEPDYDSLVQTTAAARILGVASETVRAMERRGALPAIKTARGVRLFDRRVVEQLARERAGERAGAA